MKVVCYSTIGNCKPLA